MLQFIDLDAGFSGIPRPRCSCLLTVLNITHSYLVFSQHFASGTIVKKNKLLNQRVMVKQI